MALPQDAKHDFYSIAGGNVDHHGDGVLKNSELWAEAVFFLPAGQSFFIHLLCLSLHSSVFLTTFQRSPGGTTLSTALSATFFYLSRHPAVYTRLAAEIRSTFNSGRDIQSGAQLSGCKYLRAVIDESLRIAPPLVNTLWREPYNHNAGPFVVDGQLIPRGTMVGVNPYCLMHNEAYFPEPFEFRPDRWLQPEKETLEDEVARATMRKAFMPFAMGDSGCVGKSMAYLETSLTIAKTMWYLDFEQAAGEAGKLGEGEPGRLDGRGRKEEYQLYDITTADHDGPNLVFKPREAYWKDLGC